MKHYRCLGHGLKMSILFGYNPQIIFCYFFLRKRTQVIFPAKVNRYLVPCVRNSSYSCTPIPLKLYRCLGHGLKMCILFAYNPQIICCHFFKLNLANLQALLHSKLIDSGYRACVTPTVLCRLFWNFTDVLVMVWRCTRTRILDIILRLFLLHFIQVEFSRFFGIYYH